MAGFSYSSKLAVMSNGFPTKLKLFSELLKSRRVFWYSWLFYLARILISLLFVLLIPILSLLTVENFFIRILIASISAAPAYSYVKMASFKFFLEVYRPYPEVVAEYQSYYSRHFGWRTSTSNYLSRKSLSLEGLIFLADSGISVVYATTLMPKVII